MTSIETIGAYLDRPILLHEASGLNGMEVGDLSHTIALLWLGEKSWDSKQLEEAIKELAAKNALNITVAGERSNESFSILLETLGPLPLRKHIMTGVFESTNVKDAVEDSLIVRDAIERFLMATWPDEDRFDNWTEYRIIVIGRPDLSQQIRHSVAEIVLTDR
jgi:hypothetical protein